MSGLEDGVLRFTQAAAHWLWVGALLWLAAFLAERLLVRTSAGRHGVHLLGLALSLVAFPLCFLIPRAADAPSREPEVSASADMPEVVTESAAAVESSEAVGAEMAGEEPPAVAPVAVDPLPAAPSPRVEGPPSVAPDEKTSDAWRKVAPWATAAYAVGLVLMTLRLLLGWAGSARLRKRAEPMTEGPWPESLAKMSRWFEVRGRVAVAWSREVAAPVVMGLAKPVILVPVALASRLSPAQVEAVLAHELAHLHRRDHWAVVVQRLAETVLFFHPAVWWMSRRMDALREEACDNYVVAAGCEPADYAEALVICSECRLERNGTAAKFAERLAATGSSGAPLKQRVLRVLGQGDDGPVRLGRVGWVLAVLALGGIALAVVLGGLGRNDLADFDFDDPPGGYEKGVEVADRDQVYRVDGLRFEASPLEWVPVRGEAGARSEEGPQWELNLDLGEDSGYEVVEIRLFDHSSREHLHTSKWREPRVENPDFLVERIGASASLRLRETGGSLPEAIDVWLRVVTEDSGPVFSIPAVEGAVATLDGSELVITRLFAGSASGRGDGTGAMEWDMTTLQDQDRTLTLNIRNRGRLLAGRYHVVAVTKDGARHPMDDRHFREFRGNGGRHAYVRMDVALDEVDHFEVIPFKARHKFFFNGLDVPARGELPETSEDQKKRLEALFERRRAGDLSEKDFLLHVTRLGPGVVAGLIEYLDSGPTDVLAMKAIEQFKGHPLAVAYLERTLEELSDQPGHIKPNRRYCGVLLLGKMGGERHADLIAGFLEEKPWAALPALATLGGDEAIGHLKRAFDRLPEDAWWVIAQNLERAGEPSVVPELKRRLAMVEAPPTERFTNNTVPAFLNAIRKLSGEGDDDSSSIVWQQGQHFVYPFDGPGIPKSFSVDPPGDHYVRLPKVDAASDAGRAAIWQTFAEETEGPGFTIDGDEIVLFNGLRAMPLWEGGPPYPTTMWDWLGRVSHRELVARAKADAARDRVTIPDHGYLLALDPEDRLYGLSLKKTTDDPQYSVGLRPMDPLRQLVQPSPQANGPYTEWRGLKLHDLESGAENGALNLNRGHMVHLEDELFRQPGPDAVLTAEFAGGKIALGVPGAEEFVLVEAEEDLPADELVRRLASARLEKPGIEGHAEVGNGEWRGHQFDRLEDDRCFGFAVRMPDGIPVAGLLVVREADFEAQTFRGKHVMLFTEQARQVFGPPMLRLERTVFRGSMREDDPFEAEWRGKVPGALRDHRASYHMLLLEEGRYLGFSSHESGTVGELARISLDVFQKAYEDGRGAMRYKIRMGDGDESVREIGPLALSKWHPPLGRNTLSPDVLRPLLWMRGETHSLLLVGRLLAPEEEAQAFDRADFEPDWLKEFQRDAQNAASLPREVLAERARCQLQPDVFEGILERADDPDLRLALMYDSEERPGPSLAGGQPVAEHYYLRYLPRASSSRERCHILTQLSVLFSTNIEPDLWEERDDAKSRRYAEQALEAEPERIGKDTIRARYRLAGPDLPSEERFDRLLEQYAWMASFDEEGLREQWLPGRRQAADSDRDFQSFAGFVENCLSATKNNLLGVTELLSGWGFKRERLRRIVDQVPDTELGRAARERLAISSGARAEKAGKPVARLVMEGGLEEQRPPEEIDCRLDGERITLDQLHDRLETRVREAPDLHLFIFIQPDFVWANLRKARKMAEEAGVEHVEVSTDRDMLVQLEAQVRNFHLDLYGDSGATLTFVDSAGRPIPGVRVQFEEQAKTIENGQSRRRNVPVWKGVSDASGQVPIPDADNGDGREARLWLRAEAEGYLSRWHHYDMDIRSRPDGTWEDQRYLMLKAGVVSGRVLDAEGRPLPGAPLSVSTHCNFEDHWQGKGDAPHGMSAGISNHLRAITDENGEFRIEGAPPGSAMVYYPWSGPLAGENARWAKWTRPGEPFPQAPVTDRAWVGILSLDEGEQVAGLVADLSKSTATVEGRVVDGRQRPVPDAQVWVVWKAGNYSKLSLPWSFEGARSVTGPDGRFRLSGLPPGEAGLLVKHKQLESGNEAVPVTLESGQSRRVDLSLQGWLPGGGTVEAAEDPLPAEARVEGEPSVRLVMAEAGWEKPRSEKPACWFDGERIGLESLRDRLKERLAAEPEMSLAIHAHGGIPEAEVEQARRRAVEAGVREVFVLGGKERRGRAADGKPADARRNARIPGLDSEAVWTRLFKLPPVAAMRGKMRRLRETTGENAYSLVASSPKPAGERFQTEAAWASTVWPPDAVRDEAYILGLDFPDYRHFAIWQVFLVNPESGEISLIKDRRTGERISLDDWLKLETPTSVYGFEEAKATKFEDLAEENMHRTFRMYEKACRLLSGGEEDQRAIELFRIVGLQAQNGTDYEFCRRAAEVARASEAMAKDEAENGRR
ncbi:M56 family metallopeptidase [Haloferula sp. A504]|uniref:M56 family metallopeptidase n=1 Tax=Haloferula sp. A504 TaxID=3373601 RepID=UPI0031BCE1E2|nr:carboxypeptidase regulatory-like domain-containing protein [Verrucomicrobiaceae bacterium E54]